MPARADGGTNRRFQRRARAALTTPRSHEDNRVPVRCGKQTLGISFLFVLFENHVSRRMYTILTKFPFVALLAWPAFSL
jgi:hypothetical protein